jgi:hypothetical protein
MGGGTDGRKRMGKREGQGQQGRGGEGWEEEQMERGGGRKEDREGGDREERGRREGGEGEAELTLIQPDLTKVFSCFSSSVNGEKFTSKEHVSISFSGVSFTGSAFT